jgi:hypothetical protein
LSQSDHNAIYRAAGNAAAEAISDVAIGERYWAKDGVFMDSSARRKLCFLLRLPLSLREKATDLARHEGISLNHFIGLAVAEKISRMEQIQSPVVHPSRPLSQFPNRLH